MNKPAFRVFFNERKQWVDVFIADSPARFKRRNDCHAYYLGAQCRKQRRGLFGFIHLSQMDDTPLSIELMAHEIQHMIFDWWLCRKGNYLTAQNEEFIATITGQFSRAFWAKWKRWSNG